MNKIATYLKSARLRLLFALIVGALLAALLVEEWIPTHGPILRSAFGVLFALVLLALLVIAWRLLRFHARLHALLRRLVAGDYEVALAIPARWWDEISELERLFNRLIERLRDYDVLRTKRIRQLRMTLDLVLEYTEEPMALFEVEKSVLSFNAAMSGMLESAKQSIQLETLRNLESNKSFVDLLTLAVEEEKSPQEGRVEIQIPGQESSKEAHLRVVPYRDKDGSVPLAVVFGRRISEQATQPFARPRTEGGAISG